jgi:hypothetical protein
MTTMASRQNDPTSAPNAATTEALDGQVPSKKLKKLTDERFVAKWIASWRRGHTLTEFATAAKIPYHAAVNRQRALMRIEVDLPPLRGQQGIRPSTWDRTTRLKELVAKLITQQ